MSNTYRNRLDRVRREADYWGHEDLTIARAQLHLSEDAEYAAETRCAILHRWGGDVFPPARVTITGEGWDATLDRVGRGLGLGV